MHPTSNEPVPHGPLCIVVNAGSGHAGSERVECIRTLLSAAHRSYRLFEIRDPGALPRVIKDAIETAEREDGVIVASGGDGTLNAVVQRARHSKQPFAILPQGTFNYFGRGLGISSDLAVSVPALLDAEVSEVQIGLVNDHAFLVNASVGLYPELLEQREVAKQRFGRSRWIAFLAAARTLLSRHRTLHLRVETEHALERQLHSTTLFVGNSALQLARIGIAEAAAVERGRLAAVVVKPVGRWRMLELMIRGALGRLGAAQAVESFAFRTLDVQLGGPKRDRRVKVACDGETVWMRMPLKFSAAPGALRMLLPRERSSEDPG